MKLEVKKMGINGEGIAYYKKKPVFINDALKDEIVDGQIIKDNQKYYEAKCLKIIKKSKDRIKPVCPYYKECGACQIMHMNYKAQLDYKISTLKESLLKYADIDYDDIQIIKNDHELAYRNSLKLPISYHHKHLVTGLYKTNSNYFIKVDNCLIHEEKIEKIKKNILNVLNKYGYQNIYGLYLRILDNKVHAAIVGDEVIKDECINDLMRIEELESLYQNIRKKKAKNFLSNNYRLLAGSSKLKFNFMNLKLELSINSFFQLNTKQAIKLYEEVIKLIKPNQNMIFEAYSGIGVMSLLASKKAKKVIGVEIINDAIVNAKANAKMNKINNVEFITGDSGEILKRYAKKEKIDTLICDPPRSGLDDMMLENIIKAKIDNIIYVSCNGATLAKNLNVLKKYYKINKIIALDMFSQSAHIESITSLERIKK